MAESSFKWLQIDQIILRAGFFVHTVKFNHDDNQASNQSITGMNSMINLVVNFNQVQKNPGPQWKQFYWFGVLL